MIDLKKLRELAEKAVPVVFDKDMNFYRMSHAYGGIQVIEGKLYDVPMTKIDLEFYSDANPTTVISLLDTIERYERALRFYRNEDNWLTHPQDMCSSIIADTGSRAREALNPKEGA